MTARNPGPAPVGVRPAGAASVGMGDGVVPGRLRWVVPGRFDLVAGDRVAVREGTLEWLGEVVVPAGQLVEWPDLGARPVPVVARRASDGEWPSPPPTEGRRLLESLDLPEHLLRRPASASPPGPLVLGSGSAREAAEDQRGDQQRGGEQREPD